MDEGNLPTSSRSTRSRARTRARLVAAARVVIAAKGFESATIAEIAKEADVGFGSFYNHFASKEAILDAVIDEALEMHGQMIDALTEDETDPAMVIAKALRVTLALTRAQPVWGWLIIRAAPVNQALLARLGARVRRDLQAGIASGQFKLEDPRTAQFAVGGAMMAVMSGKLAGVLGEQADVHFTEYVLRMLGVGAAVSASLARREFVVSTDTLPFGGAAG